MRTNGPGGADTPLQSQAQVQINPALTNASSPRLQPLPPLPLTVEPPVYTGEKGLFIQQTTAKLDAFFEGKPWHLVSNQSGRPFARTLDLGSFSLSLDGAPNYYNRNNTIASFSLASMVNCCGICVSTEARVVEAWQRKGLGTLLNAIRIDWARVLGYGLLLCTDIASNTPQRRVLAKNGWQDIHTFRNPRTGNDVVLSVINLRT